MYCPNCGKAEQKEKTYCRNCGEFLPDLSGIKRNASFGGDTPEDQIKTNLSLNLLGALVSLFIAVALLVSFDLFNAAAPLVSFDGRDAPPIIYYAYYFALAFFFVMSGWQLSAFYIGLKLRKHFNRRRGDSVSENLAQASIPPEQPRELLNEADFESVVPASMTENTTRTLSEKIKRTSS